MDRFLRDRAISLTLEIRDDSGDLQDATGSVTATITDGGGAAVSGSPFTASRTSTGIYLVSLSPISSLDRFDIEWNYTRAGNAEKTQDSFETVGGFLFEIDEIRARMPDLADPNEFSADDIRAARTEAEERLERLCGVAFVPRAERETLSGMGLTSLQLGRVEIRTVYSATVDQGSGPVALTSTELASLRVYPWGTLFRSDLVPWYAGARNVGVYYEHGLNEPLEPVRKAAMLLAKANLIKSPINERATSESTDVGVLRYSVAGQDGPTGIPDVDAVVEQFNRTIPAVG